MFEGWNEYYFMIGSSAAALIGLMFIVITLTAGRDVGEFESGKKLYTSPIVWHLSVILVLSGGAIAPAMPASLYAAGSGGLAILGLAMGIRSSFGIPRLYHSSNVGFDVIWYGVAPVIAYAGLGVAALAVFGGLKWSAPALAADLMVLLLISIHAEWDLVTFLAPSAGQASGSRDR